MIKTILFDLDGSLLSMDQDEFVQHYFFKLAQKMGNRLDPQKLIKSIWTSTGAMIQGDGTKVNEEVFWETMRSIYGDSIMDTLPIFEEFYQNEFQQIQEVCPKKEPVPPLIEELKQKYQLILATNPIFPSIATYSRIRWAGLDPNDFSHITTYENAHYCKPRLEYYQEIIDLLHLDVHTCLMVGNNTDEDMIARKLGMHVFLLTEHLINESNKNIDIYPHGDFQTLLDYLASF